MGTSTSKDAMKKDAGVASRGAPEGVDSARLRIQGSSRLCTARYALQLRDGDYARLFAAISAASSTQDGANAITRAAFDGVLNETLTGARWSDAARYVRDEVVTTLFDSISSTGGRSIEMLHAQALTALCVHENEISSAGTLLFSLVDSNGDGVLEQEEVLALATLQVRVDCAVRTAAHITAVDATEQLEATRKLFRSIDTNDDDVIEVGEFEEWFAALLRESRSSDAPPSFTDMRSILHRGGVWEYGAVFDTVAAAADLELGTISQHDFIDHVGSIVDASGTIGVGEGEWPPRRVLRHLYECIVGLECDDGDSGAMATEEQCAAAMALFADDQSEPTPTISYRRDVRSPTLHETAFFALFTVLDVDGRGSIVLGTLRVYMDMMVRIVRGYDARTSAAQVASDRRALHACAQQDDGAQVGAGAFSKWCAALVSRTGTNARSEIGSPGSTRPMQEAGPHSATLLTYAEMHALLGLQCGDFAAIARGVVQHTAELAKRHGPLPPGARSTARKVTITRALFIRSVGAVLAGPPVRGEERASLSHAAALRCIFTQAAHAAAAREREGAHAPADRHRTHRPANALEVEVGAQDLVAENDASIALGAMAIYVPLDDIDTVTDWLFADLDVENSVRPIHPLSEAVTLVRRLLTHHLPRLRALLLMRASTQRSLAGTGVHRHGRTQHICHSGALADSFGTLRSRRRAGEFCRLWVGQRRCCRSKPAYSRAAQAVGPTPCCGAYRLETWSWKCGPRRARCGVALRASTGCSAGLGRRTSW